MLSRIQWRSLRVKIIIWFFVPTVFILGAIAVVTFYTYRQVTEDLIIERNRELTRLLAGQLSAEMSEYTRLLASLAADPDIYEYDPNAQQARLRWSIERLLPFDSGVLILDETGQVVAADPRRLETVGEDWANRAYFQRVSDTRAPVLSDIVNDGPLGIEVVVVAVPVVTDRGEIKGAAVGMFRLGAGAGGTLGSSFYYSILKLRAMESGGGYLGDSESYEKDTKAYELDSDRETTFLYDTLHGESGSPYLVDSNAYLVDSNGRAIFHYNTLRIGQNLSSQRAVQQVLNGMVGAIRTRDLNGNEIVASFSPVPGSSWGLVTQESWAALISSSERYVPLLLLLLGLGGIAPAVVLAIGVGQITRPLAELTGAAQRIASGNFSQRIAVASGDELETLAAQFNRMATQLQESYANLERRVADRTKELATLNSIAAVVSRSLDLEEILHDALSKTCEVMHMEAGAAFLLVEQEDDDWLARDTRSEQPYLRLIVHCGLSTEFVHNLKRVPLADSAAGQAAGIEYPVVRHVVDYPQGQLREAICRENLQLIISVPLMAKGQMLGAIQLGTHTPRNVTADELSLLAAIGQQTGVAVENARLYEHAEESAAAAERSRLARDLHDEVTQTLFSASLIADVLPRIWELSVEEGTRRLEEVRQLTRGALAEMRTLLLELRPAALAEADLSDLLRQLGEATTGRARINVEVTIEEGQPLPPNAKVVLYRIAQEALNNIAKHSDASEAQVRLAYHAAKVELCVSDNGRGFDPERIPPDHLGIGIMRERAAAIGAVLSVESQIGQGTKVSVVWRE